MENRIHIPKRFFDFDVMRQDLWVQDFGMVLGDFVASIVKTQRYRNCLLPYLQYDMQKVEYLEE